jgi:hypothetical protein
MTVRLMSQPQGHAVTADLGSQRLFAEAIDNLAEIWNELKAEYS